MSAQQAQAAQPIGNDRVLAEAYRSLRSTVKFATGDRPIRSVLVVDLDRDERSTVAEHLATAFGDAGDRCVLIDTDSRGCGEGASGFFDLLRGGESVVDPSGGNFMRLGPGRSGTPDALAGDAFSSALDAMIDAHGLAVLSSAPLPRYADALAIAPRVDAVILVVTSGDTRRQRAVDARDALDRVGARILGVVMVEPKKRWFW